MWPMKRSPFQIGLEETVQQKTFNFFLIYSQRSKLLFPESRAFVFLLLPDSLIKFKNPSVGLCAPWWRETRTFYFGPSRQTAELEPDLKCQGDQAPTPPGPDPPPALCTGGWCGAGGLRRATTFYDLGLTMPLDSFSFLRQGWACTLPDSHDVREVCQWMKRPQALYWPLFRCS